MVRSSNQLRIGLSLVAVGIFSLALNLLMLTVPLYMTAVYDRVLSSRSIETLIMISVVAVGALIITSILDSARQIILTRVGARFEAELGGPVLAASLKFSQRTGGDVQGLRDLSQVRQFLSSPLVGVLFDVPLAPFYLILVYMVHPQLCWLTVGAIIILILLSILNQQLTKRPLQDVQFHGTQALLNAQVQARNAEVVRAMGMFGAGVQAWGGHNAKAMAASDVAARRNAILSGVTKFLRLMLQVSVLGYGAYLVLSDHNLSGGIIFAASIISARALAPLDQAIGGWRTFEQAIQSYRRVRELLKQAGTDAATSTLPAPVGSLSVEKLAYAPRPGTEPIIKGIQFQISPGDIVGIIGPSGAGKSTLARLLVGAIRPTVGLVRIGGDDLLNWSPEALGPHLGYLSQDIEMFPATVAQNIARMNASPDFERVLAAAKLANCHELIQRLPQGYDTLLGPQGTALSGGQRQRIALARAFFGNPKIVVLDEPNASLDSEGEDALVAALIHAGKIGITCVVITQRTSLNAALRTLIVMREGRIEAIGPRDEVLRQVQDTSRRAAATEPSTEQVAPDMQQATLRRAATASDAQATPIRANMGPVISVRPSPVSGGSAS
jgi:ATP-binding cassette subfamily C protein